MSTRCRQVSQEIQHQLSEIIVRLVETPSYIITITKVEATPDLKFATIFITVLPENKNGSALSQLKKHRGLLRKTLKKKISFYTNPQIRFLIDTGDKKRREINEILEEIKKENGESS